MSMIGKTLGNFALEALLGKGGMGEVYRAKDQKLGRDVAIKVLPEEFAKDTDRVARFQREAKLLASLNHPNIAAIYGLEDSDGTHFLVMELVEGITLEDYIAGNAGVRAGKKAAETTALPGLLKLALQITEALEAAHEKGVIHRDLKPANIKVTPDGKVKVLDFGLAKAFAGVQEDLNLSNSPTLSVAATQQGVILGTAAYMSPEQARGKPVDKRTDIWAFGVVLYEMLTGRSLFSGEDVSSTLARVLEREPDFSVLPPNLHPRIQFLLERCLKKEAQNRYSGISDARVDIQEVLADPNGVFAKPVPRTNPQARMQGMLPWVAAALILGALMASMIVWGLRTPDRPRVMRFVHELQGDQQIYINPFGVIPSFTISPDGRYFLYGTDEGLYIRSMDQMYSRLIIEAAEEPGNPFFSPDGQWIGYISGRDDKLKKISTSGGPSVVLCDLLSFAIRGAMWHEDSTIVFAHLRLGIMRISDNGGAPATIIEAPESSQSGNYIRPMLLPDGKSVLFEKWQPQTSMIMAKSLESGESKELFEGRDPSYLPTGHIVYLYENNLYAVRFDPNALEASGTKISMLEDVASYSISNEGTLIYVQGASNMDSPHLTWVDLEGNEKPVSAPPNDYWAFRISPDGTKLAATANDSKGNEDIYIWDFNRMILQRLTTNEAIDRNPLWAPDGQRIAFASTRGSDLDQVYWMPADGSEDAEKLVSAPDQSIWPMSWAEDGKILLTSDWMEESGSVANVDIGMFLIEGESERRLLVKGERMATQPRLSPDGKLLAYMSDESGKNQIYVCPFPALSNRQQVSAERGRSPLWSPDGRKIYFRRMNAVIEVSVETEPTLRLGKAKTLFEKYYLRGEGGIYYWDIHPDGNKFLMLKPPISAADDSASEDFRKINIVLNWFEELKDRVPTD